jgi:hypothetical protein
MNNVISITEARKMLPGIIKSLKASPDSVFRITVDDEVVALHLNSGLSLYSSLHGTPLRPIFAASTAIRLYSPSCVGAPGLKTESRLAYHKETRYGREARMEHLINRIRFFHFISGVLLNQQADPICGHCKAFANTVRWTREGISSEEAGSASGKLPAEVLRLLSEAQRRMAGIVVSEDTVGQKKAGNCKMPEGVCFVKIAKSILERL